MPSSTLAVGNVVIGGGSPLAFVVGPCVIEDEGATIEVAEALADISRRHGIPIIFKASFDKANRTAIGSFRGPGMDRGLEVLRDVRSSSGLPVTTDVHLPEQVPHVAEVVDLLQIPAFLCRQTDLLLACARAGRPVNVKKGQFMAPGAMGHVVDKLRSGGSREVMLTERGTTFGHGDLIVDFRGVQEMKALGVPVCYDATHSVQLPAAAAGATGGRRDMVAPLARAAVAVGVDAVFMEVHLQPPLALSDAGSQVAMADVEPLMLHLRQVASASAITCAGRRPPGSS